LINNNRQQNGRRRGRGGQRQGGGGNQGNGSRIDNRARGNAAQLLEKYKNLAADAQRQGDRVNTEYYLQFADHYFRVVSEQRGRFEEQDRQRQQSQGYDANFDGDDFDGDEGESRADAQPQREAREERGGRERNREERGGRDGNREGGRERFRRDRDEERAEVPAEGVPAVEGEPIEASEQQPAPRARRTRRTEAAAPAADTFDATRLPPSFAPANDGADEAGEPVEAEAKPRRRRLRPAGEATQAG
jgi:hypothetical protein